MNLPQRITQTAACLLVGLGLTGCSAFQTSHVIEPEPAVSPNALALADTGTAPQAFSLVAADSIGLQTFGFEIAAWDNQYQRDELAAGLETHQIVTESD